MRLVLDDEKRTLLRHLPLQTWVYSGAIVAASIVCAALIHRAHPSPDDPRASVPLVFIPVALLAVGNALRAHVEYAEFNYVDGRLVLFTLRGGWWSARPKAILVFGDLSALKVETEHSEWSTTLRFRLVVVDKGGRHIPLTSVFTSGATEKKKIIDHVHSRMPGRVTKTLELDDVAILMDVDEL